MLNMINDMKKLKPLFLTLLLPVSVAASASETLFKKGKSSYVIAIGAAASTSEQTAAKELQQYIQEAGGVTLPIVNYCPKGNYISVGFNNLTQETFGEAVPTADDETLSIKTKDGNLYLYGGSNRGTMYAVYSFLEKYLGVRWYTPEFTMVPKTSRLDLPEVDFTQSPSIRFRFVQYHNAMRDEAWMAHNKMNTTQEAKKNEHGGISGYWGIHTCDYFIPSSEYYEDHPEYFCLRDGKRVGGYSQPCLSNPEVLRICIEKMKKVIAENPDYFVYDMSQNDNQLFCECDHCKELEERYGGHSGLFVWFVNQVADAIRTEWPDKYIGTFAYLYTRQAPTGIVPRDNVLIRLCNSDCDFSHPIETAAYNRTFKHDLQSWSKIAPCLYIWDYVVNFHQYLAPYPNFGVLADNIKTFRDNHAIGIQEEANYQKDGGEFSEMRAWVLARLLWDPEQDTDALVHEFITDFYGAAAPQVQSYFDLCRGQIRDNIVMPIYFNHEYPLYDETFIDKAWNLLEEGKKLVAGDEELSRRFDRVRLQIIYLKQMRHPEESKQNGIRDELLRILGENKGILVNEWTSSEDFIKTLP